MGLVDVIGGLDTALELAREAADLLPEQTVHIIEMPDKGLFRLPFGQEEDSPFDIRNMSEWEYFRLLLEHGGRPLPVTPPGLYPE